MKPGVGHGSQRATRLARLFLQEDLDFLLTNRIPRRWATLFMGWLSRVEGRRWTRLALAIWRQFLVTEVSSHRPDPAATVGDAGAAGVEDERSVVSVRLEGEELLCERVSDGVIVRLVGKWLNAGVLDGGVVRRLSSGTPQGGVISPLLANIYLHHVLDKWWAQEVVPRLRGKAILIRYADDFTIGFELEEDARRVHAVLPRRFGKYGLTLHPGKTRLLRFGSRSEQDRPGGPGGGGETFDFLGFTHYWGKTKTGKMAVTRRTIQARFSWALRAVTLWCRSHRHLKVAEQARQLARKLLGHYAYYGITGNMRALSSFLHQVQFVWWKWLSRRSHRARMPWSTFSALWARALGLI